MVSKQRDGAQTCMGKMQFGHPYTNIVLQISETICVNNEPLHLSHTINHHSCKIKDVVTKEYSKCNEYISSSRIQTISTHTSLSRKYCVFEVLF